MKIIKRDGRIVEYDADKIKTAIGKANNEVDADNKVTDKQIDEIIKYIEGLKKKRMLVEDIQDIIEERLMRLGKYILAKEYIIYRYTRALVRKSNTTDESILSLIKNPNASAVSQKNPRRAYAQRDLIAGEISKDLTKRMLLPEKIAKAHEEGILYFHDMEYFLQPIFNASLINLEDMLTCGTVINGKFIDSPKGFQAACNITVQILSSVGSGQYGEQSIDIKCLGKYLRKSYDKIKERMEKKYQGKISKEQIEELVKDRVNEELITGVQTLQYQTNTLMTTNGQSPFVTFYLNLEEANPYVEENAKIMEEILKHTLLGIKNETGEYITCKYPKLIYVLNEQNSLNGGKYDYLTQLALKTSIKRLNPSYLSAKKMKEKFKEQVFSPIGSRYIQNLWKDKEGKYRFEGRFNQGVVSLNLPQIAIISNKDNKSFWNLLDERLDLCFEALMCRHYALLGTPSDISPIHWQYGAIARLTPGEKIDRYLKDKYSSLALGYVGVYECVKYMDLTNEDSKAMVLDIINRLKETCKKWELETGIAFVLCDIAKEEACYKLVAIDKERFGNIKDITDKECYMNSYHIDYKGKISEFEKLNIEASLQEEAKVFGVTPVSIACEEKVEEIIKYAYDNILYLEFDKRQNN